MSQCERSLETFIKARTSTGPAETQTLCQIGSRLDIKHYLWMKNVHSIPVEITSFSQIISDQKLIRFERADQPEPQLSGDTWSAICTLDAGEETTFYVGLLSNRSDGTEQNVEVKLVIDRWHGGPKRHLTFPPITVSS